VTEGLSVTHFVVNAFVSAEGFHPEDKRRNNDAPLPSTHGRSTGDTNYSSHTNYVFGDLYQGRSYTTLMISIGRSPNSRLDCLPRCPRDHQRMFGLEFHLAKRPEPCCLACQAKNGSNDVRRVARNVTDVKAKLLSKGTCRTDICFPVEGPWSRTTEYSAHSPSPKMVSPCFHISEFEYTTCPRTDERIASPASISAI
jgi:hypothetical protein